MKNLIKVLTILLFIISCTPEQQRYFVNDSPNANYTPTYCTLEEARGNIGKSIRTPCTTSYEHEVLLENEEPRFLKIKKACGIPLNETLGGDGLTKKQRDCYIRLFKRIKSNKFRK